MIIRERAYPRAGLVGNPSDGYFGKTISFVFGNFQAGVVLYETPELEIVPNTRDHSRFDSLRHLVEDVQLNGYYGGIRLLKATVKRFGDYCDEQKIALADRNFTIRYHTTIPSQVGLAGSSAIITACLRALMRFYGVAIAKPIQANLILSVEKRELGITAGLQDRVAQVYEGLVYMDFNQALMDRQGYGRYEYLDLALLPPVYIAYKDDLSESSEVVHNDLRDRFERGESDVLEAIRFWGGLTDRVREALLQGRKADIGPLLNSNCDMRRKVCRVSRGNLAMMDVARSVGASAKFSGSGGAIVGTYTDADMFQRLAQALSAMHVKVIKPQLIAPREECV